MPSFFGCMGNLLQYVVLSALKTYTEGIGCFVTGVFVLLIILLQKQYTDLPLVSYLQRGNEYCTLCSPEHNVGSYHL